MSVRPRILVIDDSEMILARIKLTLSAEGYEVITTTRTVGNAGYLPTCKLVIIDYHMPGIDGAAVLQSLRQAASASSHRCVFFVYTSDDRVAANYAASGFDGCISQKGDDRALIRQVRAIFNLLDMQARRRGATNFPPK